MPSKFDFTIRIYKPTSNTSLQSINHITISSITIVSKPEKFGGVCIHKGNQKKYGYSFTTSKSFSKVAGSHSYPILHFKGEFIDIHVKDFPRYPTFTQDYYDAKSILNGFKCYKLNQGYPIYLLYRKVEIKNQKQS